MTTVKLFASWSAVHPQVVGIGARRLRRLTVAPSAALDVLQTDRLIPAEAA